MYRTKEIAEIVGVHPNTVRIYEEWGFISPVPRRENGYRVFSDIHLFQLKIARALFQCEIVQGNLRNYVREIVYTCGREDFTEAERMTRAYLRYLEKEYIHAISAAKVVEGWLKKDPIPNGESHSRQEVAKLLGSTPEAIRNWERNGLISVPRLENGNRSYGEREIEQLRVIRSLRSAHYSINSIHRLLTNINREEADVIEILNTPTEHEDIVSVTDRLAVSLLEAMQSTRMALELFKNKPKAEK